MKKSNKIKIVVTILVIIILIISSYPLVNSNNKTQSPSEEMKLSFDDRIKSLDDVNYEETIPIGWIQVQGTKIDLPVLIVGMNATIATSVNYAWQSINYKQGENREVIISHNLLNLSSQPSTNSNELAYFEELMSFVYYDFATENMYIQYTKDGISDLYVIYAVGFFDNGYDLGQSFSNSKNITSYIKKVTDNSLYNYNIDVDSTDTLITLKTCTRFFGNDEKQQFQIDARKIRKDEKIYKYLVEKSDVYYELFDSDSNIKTS